MESGGGGAWRDPAVLDALARHLDPLAHDARGVADELLWESPDPGLPPAPEAVLSVQQAASEAALALAAGVEELVQTLRVAADGAR